MLELINDFGIQVFHFKFGPRSMKASTVHSLLTARVLYDEAVRLIGSEDRHMCSAGLVMLQDALEIIFLAMLTEKDIDEQKALESKTFDELVSELRKTNVKVPKSGTLKALNKQRVITKHYGQLAEPVTVRNYAEAAEVAIASILQEVLGKSFRDIFLSELLDKGEARDFLNEAAVLIDEGRALDALISIRKAIYVEIEHDYAINKWVDANSRELTGLIGLGRGGHKAPHWTRNKEWIEQNVKDPIDYVQVDHERLRLDGMEWGVSTADLENIRRLTPNVFRPEKDAAWHIKYDMGFPQNEGTNGNARYCLDRAISILLRKQQHTKAKRWAKREIPFDPPTIYLDAPIFERASQDSKVVHHVDLGYEYMTHRVVTGFNASEQYLDISGWKPDAKSKFGSGWISGYLLIQPEDGD